MSEQEILNDFPYLTKEIFLPASVLPQRVNALWWLSTMKLLLFDQNISPRVIDRADFTQALPMFSILAWVMRWISKSGNTLTTMIT